MPRMSWKKSEVDFIVDNYASMTTEELSKELGRSKKSINRKIEKLREEGKIGHRDKDTVRRAYYQRKRGPGSKSSGRKRGRIPTSGYDYEEV